METHHAVAFMRACIMLEVYSIHLIYHHYIKEEYIVSVRQNMISQDEGDLTVFSVRESVSDMFIKWKLPE